MFISLRLPYQSTPGRRPWADCTSSLASIASWSPCGITAHLSASVMSITLLSATWWTSQTNQQVKLTIYLPVHSMLITELLFEKGFMASLTI